MNALTTPRTPEQIAITARNHGDWEDFVNSQPKKAKGKNESHASIANPRTPCEYPRLFSKISIGSIAKKNINIPATAPT